MLHDDGSSVFVFLYDSAKDGPCFADEWYAWLSEAETACESTYGIIATDWTEIDDPLPGCQHDWIAPVRVQGRADGTSIWEEFERLKDGVWQKVKPV
jgi:hypothetical protein